MSINEHPNQFCLVVFRFFVEDLSRDSIDLQYPPENKAEAAWNAIHFMSNYDSGKASNRQLTFNNHSDLRKQKSYLLYTWHEFSVLEVDEVNENAGYMEGKDVVGDEHGEDKATFYYGHPDIEKTRGFVHFYRTSETFPMEEIDTNMLVLLAVRATIGIDQLLMFTQNFLNDIEKLQILFQADSPFYMAFILFFSSEKCRKFYSDLNGKPFTSLEPELTCQCAFVKEISTQCKENRPGKESSDATVANLQELPQCIICLERMDESVEGLLTAPCNHEFHLNCLKQYKSTDCPVCRYSLVPDAKTSSECLECGASEDLWLCLICGFIGCGRYLNRHAVEHFEATEHTFAKQMDSERVWDYARDQYVHRLIQNKSDGKMVEYTVETPFSPSNYDLEPASRNGSVDNVVSVTADDKMDSIQIEYSYLISSELEKQRVYYEEKLRHMEIESKEKEIQLQSRLKGVVDEKGELEKQLSQVEKSKSAVEKKFADLKARFDISEKVKKAQYQEVEEMNKCLLANQNELKAKLAELEKEKAEMEDMNRDLMMTLSTQQKMAELPDGERSDISSGSIHIAPNSSVRPKRRTNNKR